MIQSYSTFVRSGFFLVRTPLQGYSPICGERANSYQFLSVPGTEESPESPERGIVTLYISCYKFRKSCKCRTYPHLTSDRTVLFLCPRFPLPVCPTAVLDALNGHF